MKHHPILAIAALLPTLAFAKGHGEESITREAAPAPVQTALEASAKTGKLEELNKITENDTVTYEAEVTTAEGTVEVKFDATGKELARKLEQKKDKEEDDDDDEENDDDDDGGHEDNDNEDN